MAQMLWLLTASATEFPVLRGAAGADCITSRIFHNDDDSCLIESLFERLISKEFQVDQKCVGRLPPSVYSPGAVGACPARPDPHLRVHCNFLG